MAPADGNGHAVLEFTFGSAMTEGSLPVQKFVDHDSEGPNVGFGSVNVLDKSLWRHVNGRADVDILEFGPFIL